MTSHLGFLWQMLGIILGFIAFTLAITRYFSVRQSAALFFALSIVMQIIRTIVFSLANYGRLSSLSILPQRFESLRSTGLVYIVLVSVSAYFMFLGTWSSLRIAPRRALSIGYWLYFSTIEAIIILQMTGIFREDRETFMLSYGLLHALPFALCKLFLIGSCAVLLLQSRRSGNKSSRVFLVGIASLFASQVCELAIRFFDALIPPELTSLLFQASFYTAAFCFLISIKPVPPVFPAIASGLRLEDFRMRYDLGDAELRMLSAILAGASNKEIAFDEKLPLSTIKYRIFVLYRKLGVASRYELMAISNRQP